MLEDKFKQFRELQDKKLQLYENMFNYYSKSKTLSEETVATIASIAYEQVEPFTTLEPILSKEQFDFEAFLSSFLRGESYTLRTYLENNTFPLDSRLKVMKELYRGNQVIPKELTNLQEQAEQIFMANDRVFDVMYNLKCIPRKKFYPKIKKLVKQMISEI